MTLAPSKRLDEYVHDVVVVLLLPFILAFLPGIAVYLFLLENVSRHLPLSLKAAYDLKMFLWVFLTDALLLSCVTGRISLYVWNKEIQLDMCPPPLHVMRKWGLVFCWTENLTDVPAALVRWSRRKLRRLRVRLLWILRRVRNRCSVGVQQTKAHMHTRRPSPAPVRVTVPTQVQTSSAASAPEIIDVTATPPVTLPPIIAIESTDDQHIIRTVESVDLPEMPLETILEDEDELYENPILTETTIATIREYVSSQTRLAHELIKFCRTIA